MKRIVAMLLVVAMTVVTFAGCGQSVEEAASPQTDTEEPTAEVEAEVAEKTEEVETEEIETEEIETGEIETEEVGTETEVEGTEEVETEEVETEAEVEETEEENAEDVNVGYTYTEMETVMWAKSSVNVRNLPSTDGEKVGSLKSGEEVAVTAQCVETGWYRIGENMYVSGNYLVSEKLVVQQAQRDKAPDSTPSASDSLQSFSGAWASAQLLTDILSLVNDARAETGVGALVWDNSLDADAMRRAVEISTNFAHENVPARCGENIHMQSWGCSAEDAFNSWWNSQGHHDNMLNEKYTRISVALFFDGRYYYASMLLGL